MKTSMRTGTFATVLTSSRLRWAVPHPELARSSAPTTPGAPHRSPPVRTSLGLPPSVTFLSAPTDRAATRLEGRLLATRPDKYRDLRARADVHRGRIYYRISIAGNLLDSTTLIPAPGYL
jgi:hypothetical protein